MQQQEPAKVVLELEHSIGYNGKYSDTIHFNPVSQDTMFYNIGGLLCVENVQDKAQQKFLLGHDMEVSAIAVARNGIFLATGQKGTVFQKQPDASVILWNINTKVPLVVLKGLQGCVRKLAFSADDRMLAAIGDNNLLMVWDTSNGQVVVSRTFDAAQDVLCWDQRIMQMQNAGVHNGKLMYHIVTANEKQVLSHRVEPNP